MEKLIPIIEKIHRECNNGGISKNSNLGKNVNNDEYVVYKKWNSSGYSGGNCWNDNPATSYEGECEPNFYALDKILEVICPKITYLQYKKLTEIIVKDEYTEYEYYGNSSTYSYEFIYLSDLLKWVRNSKIDSVLNEID
jgi:hypothetical protein